MPQKRIGKEAPLNPCELPKDEVDLTAEEIADIVRAAKEKAQQTT